jgi:hypothetical protein
MLRGIAAYVRRHHIALLALFFALGGTAVAASNSLLPKNSVGSKQVINGSLAKADLSGKAVKALKGNKGARGIPGAAGPQGPAGPQGVQGVQGVPGPFTDALPAGQTLRGNYMLSQTNATATNFHNAVSFGFRLSAAPTVHYINSGTAPPAQCPGTVTNPQAAPGHLCIYEVQASNVSAGRGACNPEVSGCPGNSASRDGFAVYGGVTGAGAVYMFGSWAVTAPAAAALTPAAPQSHGASTIG